MISPPSLEKAVSRPPRKKGLVRSTFYPPILPRYGAERAIPPSRLLLLLFFPRMDVHFLLPSLPFVSVWRGRGAKKSSHSFDSAQKSLQKPHTFRLFLLISYLRGHTLRGEVTKDP